MTNHGIPKNYDNYLCVVSKARVGYSVSIGHSAVAEHDEPFWQNGITVLVDKKERIAIKICFNGDYTEKQKGFLVRHIRNVYFRDAIYLTHTNGV